MNYTADAMKFIVQGENTLSPMLRQVRKDYDKACVAMERSNKKLYDTVSKGMEVAASLTHDLTALPAKANKAVTKLTKAFADLKPIHIPVKFKVDKSVLKGLPKFAEGGYVPGSNLPKGLRMGKDGTLILASAGELVVPAETAKRIMELAQSVDKMNSAMMETAGKFDVGKAAVGSSLEHFAAKLSEELVTLEKTAKGASSAVAKLGDAEKKVTETSAKVAETQDKKVSKSLDKSTKAAKEYKKQLDDVDEEESKVNRRRNNTADDVQEGILSKLKSIGTDTRYLGIKSAADVLFGSPTNTFDEWMDQSNRALGMSRMDLTKLKHTVASAAGTSGVSMQKVGEAYNALVMDGMRGSSLSPDQAVLVGQLSQATNQSSMEMVRELKMSQQVEGYTPQQVRDIILQRVRASQVTGIPYEAISQHVQGYRSAAGVALGNTPSARVSAEKAAGQLSALLYQSNVPAPLVDQILQNLAYAQQNQPDALQHLGTMQIGRGALEQFQRGDISGVVGGLGQYSDLLRGMGPNAMSFSNAAGLGQSPQDIQALIGFGAVGKGNLAALQAAAIPSDKVAERINDLVKNTQTFGEQFENHIQRALTALHLDQVYTVLKEADFPKIVTALYAGRLIGGAALSGGKWLTGLGGKGLPQLLTRKSASSLISTAEDEAEQVTGNGIKSITGLWGAAGDAVRITATGAAIAGVVLAIGKAATYAAPAIEASAKGMVSVVRAIGGMTDDKTALDMSRVEKTGQNIEAVGKVMRDLKTMIFDYNKAAGMSLASGMVDAFIADARAFFPFTTSLVMGDANGNAANSPIVNSILHGVSQSQIIITELSRASLGNSATVAQNIKPTLDALSTVMFQLHNFMYNVVQSGRDAQGLESSFMDKIKGVDGGLNALTSMSPHIQTFALTSVNSYADIAKKLDDKTLDDAKTGIGKAADLVLAMSPFFSQSVELGNMAKGLERSNWDWIKGLPGGITALENMADALPKNMQTFNDKFVAFHKSFDPDSVKGVNDAGLLAAGLEPMYEHISKIGQTSKTLQANDLEPLEKIRTRLFNVLYATGDDFLRLSQSDPYKHKDLMLGAFGTSLQMVSEYGLLLDSIDAVGQKHTSSLTLATTLQKVNEAVGPMLHELSNNFLFSPETSKAIRVQVQASNEEKQSLDALNQMVALLTQIVAMQAQGKSISPEVAAGLSRMLPQRVSQPDPILY